MVYVPGTSGNDINPPLSGSDAADLIDGMGGDDWLFPFKRSAGGQYDVVDGGDGFDTMLVNMAGETQQVSALQSLGGYEVKSLSGNYWVVADRIERVSIVGGDGNDLLQGLSSDDVLSGGEGNDTLDGFFGFDTLNGGTGTDTVDQRFYNGDIVVNLTSGQTSFPGQTGVDTLISIENFWSGNGHDVLSGNEVSNVLHAGGGNDTINGLNGADRLFGAAGDDTLNGGNDKDQLYGGDNDDELLGGSHNDELFGENGVDDLQGGPGGDVLNGGFGFDTLNGGDGFDYADYRFYDDATIVNLATGRTSFVGQTGVERLIAIEGAIMGNGNDTVTGSSVGNTLWGGGGRDYLDGGAGNDYLLGDGLGSFLTASPGADTLIGGTGDDTLDGYNGKDTLIGGLGKDSLYGKADADRFDFNGLKDSPANSARDIIRDFSRGGGDRIDLSTIDANYHKSGNQTFSFIGGKAFTDKEGQLHFVKKSGGVYVEGDVNGNGKADFQILVQNVGGLDRGDFIL